MGSSGTKVAHLTVDGFFEEKTSSDTQNSRSNRITPDETEPEFRFDELKVSGSVESSLQA